MKLYAHDGWPLETIKGRPFINFIRRLLLTGWTVTYQHWRAARKQQPQPSTPEGKDG